MGKIEYKLFKELLERRKALEKLLDAVLSSDADLESRESSELWEKYRVAERAWKAKKDSFFNERDRDSYWYIKKTAYIIIDNFYYMSESKLINVLKAFEMEVVI